MSDKKNLLVTGGAGFIGSNFIRMVANSKPDWLIVNLDLLTYAGNLDNLKGIQGKNYKFIKGDICNGDLVIEILREFHIDCIINFAAETHVDRSIKDPFPFIHTNIIGIYNLLESARKVWSSDKGYSGKLFHQISTDEVYGSLTKGELPFTENSKYAPSSPYAASKAASDHLLRSYFHTYSLPITISNSSNNFGPYQNFEKLIPYSITCAIKGLPIGLYGDGTQIRNWIFVNDHCEAILKIIENGSIGETYNIGGCSQFSNLEIVRIICKKLDQFLPNSPNRPHEKLIRFIDDRPGHDFRYDLNTTKINKELGWSPKYLFEEALSITIKWYLTNFYEEISVRN